MKNQIPTEDGIDMQDIRLIAGEGKLTEKTIQQTISVIRKQRLENKEKALNGLAKLSQIMEQSRIQYEEENDTWWNNLTEKEREDAFYAVCKRIHQAEIKDQGTYRWALYDVFGFNEGMYMRGMQCGFMDIHNSIRTETE